MNRVAEIRRTRISGTMDNHHRRVGDDWVVTPAGRGFAVTIGPTANGPP
jgi:propionyl-CoA carboxylase alpha chain